MTGRALPADEGQAGVKHPFFNAHRLAPRLWQGACPAILDWPKLEHFGFTMIVLCAVEKQQSNQNVNVKVVRAPNNDDDETWTSGRLNRAFNAAQAAAVEWQAGGRVLITCNMGLNRSGFVSALTLRKIDPSKALRYWIWHIQECRPEALYNDVFVERLKTLKDPT